MARHGENIRKRKDGRWEARYIQGYRTNGKAMYRSVYGRTYQEIKRKRQTCITQRGQQTAATKNCTFGEAAQMWLEERQTTPARVLSRAEQFALEHVLFAQQTPLNLGVLMSLYAGLRIGEVCALQWGDICLEEGTVFVHKTVLRIQEPCQDAGPRTRLMVTEPKTPCSRRVIPLPDFLLRYLAGAKQNEKVYLASGRPAPLEPRTCLSQYKRLLKKAGVEDTTFHTLRHTFATRCIENGMDVKSLSEIMGHSGVSITMQRYVHPSMDAKREQINRLVPLPIHGQNSGQQQSLNA